MKKNFSLVFLLVLIVFIFWRFFVYKIPQKSNKLAPIILTLDWTPNTNHTGVYVALAKGWYKQQGLDLKILPYSADVSSSVLVASGKADVGVSFIEDVVGETAKNNPLVSLGAILQHNTSGLIVLKSSGINRPKDLDGKIYGGYGSPFENPIISEIIKKDGGTGDFKNVVLEIGAMQALETKKIDFVWVFSGWELVQAKLDGIQFNYFPLTKYGIPDSPTAVFIATPNKIKSNPELLKKFMTATAQGYEYARLFPKESAQILINQTPKDTFPNPRLVFASQDFMSANYADKNKQWGVQDKKSWTGYPQFILNSNAILDAKDKPVKTVDFNALFTNQFLP
ncbi:MAG: ABC transporter substrate-binding protein [Patescibacteria group bacterium]|jgi:ABC-type nitrate/sulfonate/bicarbonate transport system substrate-binding protein